MKKTPCSIGTYVLKEVEFLSGREGGGYSAELWKGKKHIGDLEDWGDGGGVNPSYARTLSQEERAEVERTLIEDMRALQKLCKCVSTSLAAKWDYNGYSAMEGFGELLLELTDLVKMAKSTRKKHGDAVDFAVFSTGSHWFRPSVDFGRSEYSLVMKDIKDTKARTMVLKSAVAKNLTYKREEKTVPRILNLVRYIPSTSKCTWSMSFEEYAKMLIEADNVNK